MSTFPTLADQLLALFEEENTIKLFRKGDHLFQEGTEAREIYFLLSGKVQVSKVVPDGRELALRISGKGDVISEFNLFEKSSLYLANAKIIESGEAMVIAKKRFEEKLASKPEVMLSWFQRTQLDNQKTQSKLRDLILHGKKGGVYSTLIRLSNTFGRRAEDGIHIDVSLTNQEIANLCGTSREVVNRMFSDLRKKQIISTKKGSLIIHDLDYLKNEINCDNCPIDICQTD
ncbi:Crp/Fnr family transcriptional regulator [Bacillus xiapuensis]|uniref:Crp/Fnr family transcriptional regulator n=1 Tax=Bacillus xiapuensis TaxID=2014075 RepID=UPI000C247C86|nr:Crp/Fnr family transcriptional regulator [Bacillus xiapuensis]